MTISGFELEEGTRDCRVQSWYIQLIIDELDN